MASLGLMVSQDTAQYAIAASVEFSAISAELDVLAKSQRENSKAVEAKRENVQILARHLQEHKKAFEDSKTLLSSRLGDIDVGLNIASNSVAAAEHACMSASELAQKIASMVSKYEGASASVEESVRTSRKRLALLRSLRAETATVTRHVDATKTSISKNYKALNGIQARLHEDKTLLITRQAAVSSARAVLSELEAGVKLDLSLAQHDTAAAVADAAAADAATVELQAAKEEERLRHEAACARIAALREQISSARSSTASAQGQRAGYTAQVQEAQARIQAARRKHDEAEEATNQAEVETAKVEAKIESLAPAVKREENDAQRALAKAKAAQEKASAILQGLHAELATATDHTQSLLEQADASAARAREAQDAATLLEQQLQREVAQGVGTVLLPDEGAVHEALMQAWNSWDSALYGTRPSIDVWMACAEAETERAKAGAKKGSTCPVPLHVAQSILAKIQGLRAATVATALAQASGQAVAGYGQARAAALAVQANAGAVETVLTATTAATATLSTWLQQVRAQEAACAQACAALGGPWTEAKRAEMEKRQKAALHEKLGQHEDRLQEQMEGVKSRVKVEVESAEMAAARAEGIKADAHARQAAAKAGHGVKGIDPAALRAALSAAAAKRESAVSTCTSLVAQVASLPVAIAGGLAEGLSIMGVTEDVAIAIPPVKPFLPSLPTLPLPAPVQPAIGSPPRPMALAPAFETAVLVEQGQGEEPTEDKQGTASAVPPARAGRAKKGAASSASVPVATSAAGAGASSAVPQAQGQQASGRAGEGEGSPAAAARVAKKRR